MISLKKREIPEILKENGDKWRGRILKERALGKEPSTYLKRRYSHPQIKSRLIEETFEKCAYCESKLTQIAFGHIEHIIPKSKFPEATFEWENLTLACELCNHNKSDYFEEDDKLLNPYVDDPLENIVYLGPLAYGKTLKGKLTITLLDLNRISLFERRRERLQILNDTIILYNSLPAGTPIKEICRQEIEDQTNSDREYSMVISNAFEAIGVHS